jgi:hypothetical protein
MGLVGGGAVLGAEGGRFAGGSKEKFGLGLALESPKSRLGALGVG